MANPKGNPKIVELGEDTRFNGKRGCSAAVAGKKGNEVQAVERKNNATITEEIKNNKLDDEAIKKIAAVIVRKAEAGNIHFIELLLKLMNEHPDLIKKINLNADVGLDISIDYGDE